MCAEGVSGYVNAWVVWDDSDQEKIPKQWKVNYIEVCFRDEEVGDVYDVYGDLDGHKYKIQCIKDDEYFMNLFGTHGVMSKRCR